MVDILKEEVRGGTEKQDTIVVILDTMRYETMAVNIEDILERLRKYN